MYIYLKDWNLLWISENEVMTFWWISYVWEKFTWEIDREKVEKWYKIAINKGKIVFTKHT